MQKTTFIKGFQFFICLLFVCVFQQTQAQIVIATPNLGFSQACASNSFNTYNTTFIFSPPAALEATNQFIIEMSDADGNFANAVVVFTSNAGTVVTSPATLSFSLPTDTAGEGYRLRIKSTAPAATSSGSAVFAAYYKSQDTPFTINNLVSTGAYCSGASYLLTIDNPGFGENDSPLNYPSLTFNWFKETSPTTSIFVSQGSTLAVTEPGTYFVETNYGTCTSNSFSNRVAISEAISGQANAAIVSSLGNPFCPDLGLTTLTTLGGNSYQWYKDGVLISGATDQMYQTDESGTYSVQVDLGTCEASGSILLDNQGFMSGLNVDEMNIMEVGETLTVRVATTASNPVFEWYLNGSLISGANTDTYIATEFGDYKVIIFQTTGCMVSRELLFSISEPSEQFPDVDKIPNLISPNGDGINDTWQIPIQYVSGTNTEVMILTNQGKIMLQTTDYQNNWPETQIELTSVNKVFYYIITAPNQKSKKGSITVVK